MVKSYDYKNRKGIKAISWDDFYLICKDLTLQIEAQNPDMVVGIARGGLYPATLISQFLQKELYPIRLSRRLNDKVIRKTPKWLVAPPLLVKGKKILLIDDIADSGETLQLAKDKILKMGAKNVVTIAVFSHKTCQNKPDYAGTITDELIINPWDNKILKNGKFIQNPEYTKAIKLQNN